MMIQIHVEVTHHNHHISFLLNILDHAGFNSNVPNLSIPECIDILHIRFTNRFFSPMVYLIEVSKTLPVQYRITVYDKQFTQPLADGTGWTIVGSKLTPEEAVLTLETYLRMEESK